MDAGKIVEDCAEGRLLRHAALRAGAAVPVEDPAALAHAAVDADPTELRLFFEDLACDLFFFEHVAAGVPPEAIAIHQEVFLADDRYADIRIRAGDAPPYWVEIDLGYTAARLVGGIERKFGRGASATRHASERIIIVADSAVLRDSSVERAMRAALRPGMQLELWDEQRLLDAAGKRFGLRIENLREDALLALRAASDHVKGVHAFGDAFQNDPLQTSLLWHFAPWRVRQLQERGERSIRSILRPGLHRDTVVLMADICAYSSYVHDTADESISRRALTSYASKTRHQIISDGGMLYQFLGDSVVGVFGVPEHNGEHVANALRCARRLVDIGASVAKEWQRDIDKVQSAAGVHVSLALGDLQVLSFRPYSRAQVGLVGDSINLCARLNGIAGCDEIVASNTFYRALPEAAREGFEELPPVDTKNVGRLRAWKLNRLAGS